MSRLALYVVLSDQSFQIIEQYVGVCNLFLIILFKNKLFILAKNNLHVRTVISCKHLINDRDDQSWTIRQDRPKNIVIRSGPFSLRHFIL